MTFYGGKYPFGQFKSPVLTMLPPSFFSPLHLLTSRKWDTRKSLMQDNVTWQQPRHECVTNIILVLNPQHITVTATEKTFSLFQPKPGHTGVYSNRIVFLCSDPSLCPFILAKITVIHCFGYLFCVSNIFLIGHPQQKERGLSVKFLSQSGPATKISSPWNCNCS